jgi:hypothetical protein
LTRRGFAPPLFRCRYGICIDVSTAIVRPADGVTVLSARMNAPD